MITESKIIDDAENFTGKFMETGATISWSASEAGFDYVSEPPNPDRNIYSVIGHERNGFFFHPE